MRNIETWVQCISHHIPQQYYQYPVVGCWIASHNANVLHHVGTYLRIHLMYHTIYTYMAWRSKRLRFSSRLLVKSWHWYSHFTGLSLTCFCQHSRLCQGEEDVCQGQNDICFTQIHEDGTYESACYEVGSNFFSARLVAGCLNDTHQSISPGELLCCNDRDRCNEDLRPPTQQPSSNGRGSTTLVQPIITGKDMPIELDVSFQ